MAAVVHQVSGTAQRGALAFWTPARRAAAWAVPLPHAADIEQESGQPGRAPATVSPRKRIPTAKRFGGVPTIGALFSTTGAKRHFCTAAVVRSAPGDLVVTAAHCVDAKGFATNVEYVPGYHSGHLPYGAWAVRTIMVAAGWQRSHDPDLDFAFLAVGPAGGRKIQARTDGLTVGFTRWYRERIMAIGYNDADTAPVRCLTRSFRFRTGQMEYYCHGFWAGTSGGPWIAGFNRRNGTGTVFGVVGSYQDGGDYEWAWYSAYFGPTLRSLFGQAQKAEKARKPRRVRKPEKAARIAVYRTLAPYISPSGSARSSRRAPSGSRKYTDVPLSS
ncbi:MAG: trypsin-like serine peptidase [Gemmatimonadota bacterium]